MTILRGLPFAAMFLIAGAATAWATASPPVEDDTSTTYQLSSDGTYITATACNMNGCTFAGQLSSLKSPCAILEGAAVTTATTITREIYVMETGTTASPGVDLRIFTKRYFGTNTTMPVTIQAGKVVPLSFLKGGAGISCSMAANGQFIFAGTAASGSAARIDKQSLAAVKIPGGASARSVTGITADNTGYVTIEFGQGTQIQSQIFGPGGSHKDNAGGDVFLPNQTNAVEP